MRTLSQIQRDENCGFAAAKIIQERERENKATESPVNARWVVEAERGDGSVDRVEYPNPIEAIEALQYAMAFGSDKIHLSKLPK